MPTLDQNLEMWDARCPWVADGDEWSGAWGGTDLLWHATIYPRIRSFLPTGTVLELAPGHGRCTQYLGELCDRLIGIDLTEKCVEACRARFADSPHMEFRTNDGRSLSVVEDDSIDFVFSWDSLVHADADVIDAYLRELSTKMKRGAVGFIHHSNLGSFRDPVTKSLTVPNAHWRSENVSAELVRNLCGPAGLHCLAQEIVSWGDFPENDCFSLLARDPDREDETKVAINTEFWDEARALRGISRLYSKRPSVDWTDQACLSLEASEPDLALEQLTRADELGQTQAHSDLIRGRAFLDLGRHPEAADAMNRHLQKFPHDGAARGLLERILDLIGGRPGQGSLG